MTAKYQMFTQIRSTLKEGREMKLYSRIVRSRTVDPDEISQPISASSKNDVKDRILHLRSFTLSTKIII